MNTFMSDSRSVCFNNSCLIVSFFLYFIAYAKQLDNLLAQKLEEFTEIKKLKGEQVLHSSKRLSTISEVVKTNIITL